MENLIGQQGYTKLLASRNPHYTNEIDVPVLVREVSKGGKRVLITIIGGKGGQSMWRGLDKVELKKTVDQI